MDKEGWRFTFGSRGVSGTVDGAGEVVLDVSALEPELDPAKGEDVG